MSDFPVEAFRGRNLKHLVWHLKVEKPGVKYMITFKIMVVKTKFTVAKYDERPLISSPGSFGILTN